MIVALTALVVLQVRSVDWPWLIVPGAALIEPSGLAAPTVTVAEAQGLQEPLGPLPLRLKVVVAVIAGLVTEPEGKEPVMLPTPLSIEAEVMFWVVKFKSVVPPEVTDGGVAVKVAEGAVDAGTKAFRSKVLVPAKA